MIVRAVAAAALLLLPLSSEASAVTRHGVGERLSCSEVRYYVAKYSASVAEMYARSRGATDAQIQRARRCLASNEGAQASQASSYAY